MKKLNKIVVYIFYIDSFLLGIISVLIFSNILFIKDSHSSLLVLAGLAFLLCSLFLAFLANHMKKLLDNISKMKYHSENVNYIKRIIVVLIVGMSVILMILSAVLVGIINNLEQGNPMFT